MAASKPTIYYNHNFYYDFAKVMNADDRGLQFGDGAYEWIRIYHGRPFALSYHTDRLYRSMRLLGIRAVTAPDEFTEICEVITEENEIEEGYLMIVVTRGAGDHDFLVPGRMAMQPNVLVYAKPLDVSTIAAVQDGVKCISMPDERGKHCDILSLNQINNMMARQEALKKGCYDAIFLKDGLLTEASHSSVCVVKAGVIWTPPYSEDAIRGITRSLVLSRVAPTSGVTCIEEKVEKETIDTAEEVFLTNSRDGIIPVLSIDGKPVADGKPGHVTMTIQEHYLHLMNDGLP